MLYPGEILRIIEDYIEVPNGHLGDFSYRTLEEFYVKYCNLEIEIEKYEGSSKRWLFQDILEKSSSLNQAKILEGVFRKFPVESFDDNKKESKQRIKNEFQSIIERLNKQQQDLHPLEVSAHFEKIQKQIIQEINNAKHLIWVAVSWFTDKKIFSRLAHRKHEGLTVEVIIVDDEINRNSELDYEKYLTTFWAKKEKALMHNKFCIIDLKTCITGSYNWTNNAANKNKENITIKRNTETVEKYATEYLELRKQILSAGNIAASVNGLK